MTSQEFKQRFLPHHKLLYRVAYSMTGNVQDAEDLVQDLYLKLWQKRDELPYDAQNQSYLVTMIRHIFYDQRRRKQVDLSVDMSGRPEPTSGQDVERQLELQEDTKRMATFIDRLPDKERRVVEMHIVDAHSYDEIEADTGLSRTYIRVLVNRARNKLKEQFLKHTTTWKN